MVNLKRGDIVLCDLNPVRGTEQAGIRPVVIVQIDQASKVSPHTIIVPLTSKIRQTILYLITKIKEDKILFKLSPVFQEYVRTCC